MRIAIDSEAILFAFSGARAELEDILRPSILAINEKIIDDYSSKVLKDGAGLGKDWLTRLFSTPSRFRLISTEEMQTYELDHSDVDQSYVAAAFFNGHYLISPNKNQSLIEKAKDYGIQINDTKSPLEIDNMPGNAIIFNALLNSKTTYRHAIIRHFFAKEKNILIYDRYIKNSSLCLFENILKYCHKNADITIISDFDRSASSPITADAAQKRIKKIRPHANVKCYYPDLKNCVDTHDRHIHLGHRLQISFSSGTDCFGLHPKWSNSECEISVHYLSKSSAVRDYYALTSLTSRKPIIIKAYSKI
ncbi:hypothetical protein SAMN05216598_4654 [Pseudomonas asplenii]|uniref:Uncharacterized protein n=1 Tax=Pseudomonas asplenii TaxID=53407 RepID=A0A1H1YVH5_9PSED|nr:hypothetical protein [Pseudomonas asplenii]SDT25410.1 hypothetical protein SAMN05216598_4654 [Pseudomonas asplenii]